MPYSSFTLRQAKETFGLRFIEGVRFFPEIPPVPPSAALLEFLTESIPLAIAMGSEKARSELIISPLLFALRKHLDRTISLFSGEELNIDPSLGLTGVCDFIITRSSEQLFVEAPVVVMVEAKKDDLKGGLGQCIAEMVAAQRFNQQTGQHIPAIYGTVTSGNRWMFLQLTEQTVTIDFQEHVIPPIDPLLGILVWMVTQG